MKEELILNVIHIAGARMIEASIYALSRGNNMGGISIVVNPLKFIPVDEGVV